MSVAEDTTQIPTPIPDIVAVVDVPAAAIVNDLQSTISNTFEAHLNLVSETPKLVENATETILKESQVVIDETSKLIEDIATTLVGKSNVVVDETAKVVEETTKLVEETAKPIIEEAVKVVEETAKLVEETSKMIVDETTNLVESVVESVENITKIVSDEEKRINETITRLSIDMEQQTKKASSLFAKIQKFVKLIMSCIHRADKSVIIPVAVKTDHVDVNVANVV